MDYTRSCEVVMLLQQKKGMSKRCRHEDLEFLVYLKRTTSVM